ncbi:hypothetical protein O181_025992 [Austropuccinia psidii MF-1]|uniref:J domain-containing protein n=1 Tax=Austropuccinia psidii MF-1 TaxID=1389203 RepID=A0A9Q3CM98_9BASI|nr:hypothetical protein [Austropuccinia psidii MF-1]
MSFQPQEYVYFLAAGRLVLATLKAFKDFGGLNEAFMDSLPVILAISPRFHPLPLTRSSANPLIAHSFFLVGSPISFIARIYKLLSFKLQLHGSSPYLRVLMQTYPSIKTISKINFTLLFTTLIACLSKRPDFLLSFNHFQSQLIKQRAIPIKSFLAYSSSLLPASTIKLARVPFFQLQFLKKEQNKSRFLKLFIRLFKMEAENAYSLLGISRDATNDQIIYAYRVAALKYHPRRYPPHETFIQIHFKKLAEAYTVLIDPAQRREYDRNLDSRRATSATMRAQESSASGRVYSSSYAFHEASFGPYDNNYGRPSERLSDAEVETLFQNVVNRASRAGNQYHEPSHHRVPDQGPPAARTGPGSFFPAPRSSFTNPASAGHSINRPFSTINSSSAHRVPQGYSSRAGGPEPHRSRGGPYAPIPQGVTPLQSVTSFERSMVVEPDGSYHLHRLQTSRAIDAHGNIHDSVRRQVAASMSQDQLRRRATGGESVPYSTRPSRPFSRANMWTEPTDTQYQPLSTSMNDPRPSRNSRFHGDRMQSSMARPHSAYGSASRRYYGSTSTHQMPPPQGHQRRPGGY